MNEMKLQDRRITRNLDPGEAVYIRAVEPGILALVIELNAVSGVSTIASCHGHGQAKKLFKRAYTESQPYVLFRAPIEFAQGLSTVIKGGKADGRLHYAWNLRGYFHPSDFELAWYIEPCDFRLLPYWDTRNTRQWDREKVNRDLAVLADVVKQVCDSLNVRPT
jgi:hypothetical protein